MKPKGHWVGLCASILAFVLGACSAAPTPSGGGDSAVETRVAGTLAALTPGVSTETPPATELPGTEAPTAVEGTPSADGICEVVTNGLNLRDGPGTAYAPPIDIVRRGAQLDPKARNADASWIEVRVLSTGQSGWVSAAEQYVRCGLDLLTLELGVIPPTPTPSITPTPPVLVVGPIEGTVDGVVTDEVRLEISANDPEVGDENGDGIEFVRFAILFEGEIVFESVDSTPRYCAVPGDAECFYLFPEPPEWPNGDAIQQGLHTVRAIVYALNGRTQTVEAEFEVEFEVDLP